MFARTSAAARLLRCGGARARAAGRSRSLSGATEVAALGIPAQVVVAAQAATGAPWWLAIGGTTVALRVGMLPLLWYQLAETRRFGALRPQLAAIRDECRAIEPPSARAAQTLLRGWRCCRAASVQPLAIVAVPLVQIPLLIWSLVGIRRMVDAGSPLTEQMRAGGPGWQRDLTAPHAPGLLPVVSVALIVGNLQLATAGTRSGLFLAVRNGLQAAAVVAYPFFVALPAGVFACWIPNSAFSLAQHLAAAASKAASRTATTTATATASTATATAAAATVAATVLAVAAASIPIAQR
mmetsp:Transcript_34898/g.103527  ORF Transcript_34898/g.103527 Transcript_34898/m.103527 type:complete len:296 (-) Transcript_34898:741-1628(-)